MRPVSCSVVGLVVACVALATGGTASASAKKPCAAKGSTTVRSTKAVRAYDVFNSSLKATLHYGCFLANNRRTYLGQTSKPDQPNGYFAPDRTHILTATKAIVRSRFAANSTTDCINPLYFQDHRADCQTHVTVWNLRTGKVVHDHFASVDPPMQYFVTDVLRMVLQTSGSVAWVTKDTRKEIEQSGEIEVARVTAAGYTLLDRARAIEPATLRLSRTKLSWNDGEAKHTATLP
jgi:hypothetical protein